MLAIHLFGHMRLLVDGKTQKFTALPKSLPLLAYLLLNRKTPLSRANLAYQLWPDCDETTARANLRRHLHTLKNTLPKTSEDQPWLLITTTTVQWNQATDYWLDVAEFEQLIQANRLDEAVDVYGGELLNEVYEDWLIVERDYWHNIYLNALGSLVHQHQSRGEHEQAMRYALQVLSYDGMREDMVRTLMVLHYEQGDRAGAIQEYQRFKKSLWSELAVLPMPETTALYNLINENRPLTPGTPSPSQKGKLTKTAPKGDIPHNLPALLTTFIGRAEEVHTVVGLLLSPEIRLLTLTGPGGTGKTRLSLEAAKVLVKEGNGRYPDGITFVSLAPITRAELVMPAIVDALGLHTQPNTLPTLKTLQTHFQERRMLLILDNFEQVLDAVPLIGELLACLPQITVLVTSRATLHLYGENEYPVPPLPLPPMNPLPEPAELLTYAAIGLFVERARAAVPQIKLEGESLKAVAHVCQAVDGLPLAIELAAARSKHFTPEALLKQLQDRLAFLATSARNVPTRQQTLRETIAWSYNLLNEAEKSAFTQLAVFAGGFTDEAAEAVGIENAVLWELVDKSLVQTVNGRYRLLETIRQYAQAQLATQPQNHSSHEKHLAYYLGWLEALFPLGNSASPNVALPQVDLEYDNIRAAWAWAIAQGHADEAYRLARALGYFWLVRGYYSEGREVLQKVLALGDPDALATKARVLSVAGQLARRQSDQETAVAYYRQGLALAQSINDPENIARCMNGLALSLKDSAEADSLLHQSLTIFRQLGDKAQEADVLNNLGNAAFYHARYDEARQFYEESLAIRRRLGDPVIISGSLNNLGLLASAMGEHQKAHDLHAENVALRRRIGFKMGVGQSLHNLTLALCHLNRFEEAYACEKESLAIRRELGAKAGIAESCEGLCMALIGFQRWTNALILLRRAETIRQELGALRDEPQKADFAAMLDALQSNLSLGEFNAIWLNEDRRPLTDLLTEALAETSDKNSVAD